MSSSDQFIIIFSAVNQDLLFMSITNNWPPAALNNSSFGHNYLWLHFISFFIFICWFIELRFFYVPTDTK